MTAPNASKFITNKEHRDEIKKGNTELKTNIGQIQCHYEEFRREGFGIEKERKRKGREFSNNPNCCRETVGLRG